MAVKTATLVLLLSALLLAGAVTIDAEWLVTPVAVVGSLVVGLLYGLAWGWKGLLMSIAIAFVYTVASLVGIIFWLQSQPPTADGLFSGIAGVAAVILGGIAFFLALVGGVVGAVLHRRRSRIHEVQ